jgi:hypothetical protein
MPPRRIFFIEDGTVGTTVTIILYDNNRYSLPSEPLFFETL